MLKQAVTTCEVGSHTVTDVILDHRAGTPPPAVAVWVSASVPLGVDEITALFYVMLTTDELRAYGATEACRVVAELLVNGGTSLIGEASFEVEIERRDKTFDVDHWRVSQRVACSVVGSELVAVR